MARYEHWLLAYFYDQNNGNFFVGYLHLYNQGRMKKNIIKIGLCWEIEFLELMKRARKRYPHLVEGKAYIHVEFDVPDLPF